MRLGLLLTLPGVLSAQLILSGPIPKGPNPPVVFLNGYQIGCSGTDFASNFGAADKLLQANSIVTLYFDNCSVTSSSGKPSIEALGLAFGQFLAGLKYTDGSPVTQVDAVAHSMGGLILRSYLAGKQDVSPSVFLPPAAPMIRRAIFLSTPHFGSALAAVLGVDVQTNEMAPGSSFLFDLNRWNQGTDDLRGIQAISVAGTGGTGQESAIPGLDDGIVTATSSSLGFYKPGVTRLVPDCHTTNPLITAFKYCPTSAPAIAQITNDMTNPVSQIVVSFLTGTSTWQSIGTAAEASPLLSLFGGIELQLRDQNDIPLTIGSTTIPNGSGGSSSLQLNANLSAWIELLPAAAPLNFLLTPSSGSGQSALENLLATTSVAAVVKPGPLINSKGVVPAAGPAPFPLDVAPGEYVSIYGSNLTDSALSNVQVLINGIAQPMGYVSASQINFVYANSSPGMTQLTVKNSNGQNTVNVRVASAVPSIFLLDTKSTAAAENGLTGAVVGPQNPLHAGDFLALFLTGLGATTHMNGLDYAAIQPSVSLGGQDCKVVYAGRVTGVAGLDQINCVVPAGVSGDQVPIVVNSAGRASNSAYASVR